MSSIPNPNDELRAAHDTIDFERAKRVTVFKAATKEHRAYLLEYKAKKQALPRRPKDPKDPKDEEVVEVVA